MSDMPSRITEEESVHAYYTVRMAAPGPIHCCFLASLPPSPARSKGSATATLPAHRIHLLSSCAFHYKRRLASCQERFALSKMSFEKEGHQDVDWLERLLMMRPPHGKMA